MQTGQKLTIRIVTTSDAEAIASLSGEFGYPLTTSEIEQRLTSFSTGLTDLVMVAESNAVIGWIHVTNVQPLQSQPFAEIRGLVVSEAHRNTGIGTKLVMAAENRVKNQGLGKIRVRTDVLRKQTLKFYRKCGYQLTKTQEVFDKSL